jgi:adenylate cyclase
MMEDHEKSIMYYKELLNFRRNARGNIITPLLGLAANYIYLGREDEARAHAGEILAVNPDFSLEWFRKVNLFKDSSHLTPFLEALTKAGLPDTPPLQLPDKPSIAVLPFVNMSGDPKQEYFSDGITEEIITALSKTPKLFVIARNSSFTYKGKPVKVQQVGRELGVRYVLEGSVRKAGDKVRITVQLVEAKTGHHIWAERYDRELRDIFALQDEITMKIMTALRVKLTEGELALAGAKGTQNLEAYMKVLKVREQIYTVTKEGFAQARRLCKEALELDPDYASAYLYLGATHWMDVGMGTSKSPRESIKQAITLVTKAITLDDSFSYAYSLLGHLHVRTRQYDKGMAECERAIALEPNSASAHYWMGASLRLMGRHEESVRYIEKAIRLDPFPLPWYFRSLGLAYAFTGRYQEAIATLMKGLQLAPDDILTHRVLTITYSWAGRLEEAQSAVEEILRINPKTCIRPGRGGSKNPADQERLNDGLRKAGLPDCPPRPASR